MFGSSRLFISYRRSDAESIARSLFEAFKARLGADRVFFDTASIPFGEDFRRVVRERIVRSAAVLVVIGPQWAGVRNERGLRLWQDDDPVRFELLTALQSGRRIVPVRVGGAAAPAEEALPPELRALPFLNMPQLHADSFDSDVNAIYRQLVGEPDELTLRARLKALLVGAPAAALVLALAMLAATWTGAFGLLGLDAHAQRLLLGAGAGQRGEPVLLVRIDAASENALQREFGPAETAPAWRRDHARLIDRAARAGAAAVAFDLYFEDGAADADAALAQAVRRAAARSPPMRVVFGVRRVDGAQPVLTAALRDAGTWGSLCLAQRGGGALWTSPLAVIAANADRRDATVTADRPSLALAALAPGRLIEADVARRELRFDGPTPDPPLRYSTVERQRVGFEGCRTTQPGDDVLGLLLRIAPDGYWRDPARSISYARFLDGAAAESDAHWRGRVVLVGATERVRAAAPADVQVAFDGFVPRNVYGVELQADAIATLASGRVPRLLTADAELATTLVAGAIGGVSAVALYRRSRLLRRGVLAGLSFACVLLAWWLARGGWLLDPVNALFSLWLAALGVRAIQTLAERTPRFRRLAT